MKKSNVIQLFDKAKNPTKFTKLEAQMIGLQRVLDKKYAMVKHRLQQLTDAEEECTTLEQKYDATLLKYAERKGADNVSVIWLNYTARVRLTYDKNGKLEIKYE